jgi:hypothetical protein
MSATTASDSSGRVAIAGPRLRRGVQRLPGFAGTTAGCVPVG